MSSIQNTNTRTFIASEAIGISIRVKLGSTAGEVSIAGAGEDFIGVTETPVAAAGSVGVRLKNSSGTGYFTAGGAFAYGATVYGIAAGKVDDVSSGNVIVGTALEAASGSGSRVEVLYAQHLPIASVNQAVATDASSVIVLANSLRLALIAQGVITGAA
ncbi:MAG: hypothetical protein RIQ79_1510 [Verrucomicrobiota bacterium]